MMNLNDPVILENSKILSNVTGTVSTNQQIRQFSYTDGVTLEERALCRDIKARIRKTVFFCLYN